MGGRGVQLLGCLRRGAGVVHRRFRYAARLANGGLGPAQRLFCLLVAAADGAFGFARRKFGSLHRLRGLFDFFRCGRGLGPGLGGEGRHLQGRSLRLRFPRFGLLEDSSETLLCTLDRLRLRLLCALSLSQLDLRPLGLGHGLDRRGFGVARLGRCQLALRCQMPPHGRPSVQPPLPLSSPLWPLCPRSQWHGSALFEDVYVSLRRALPSSPLSCAPPIARHVRFGRRPSTLSHGIPPPPRTPGRRPWLCSAFWEGEGCSRPLWCLPHSTVDYCFFAQLLH